MLLDPVLLALQQFFHALECTYVPVCMCSHDVVGLIFFVRLWRNTPKLQQVKYHTYIRTYVRTYVLRYVLEFVPHNYCNIAIILRKFNNHGDVVVVLCLARSAGTLY